MSKYDKLWTYIENCGQTELLLSFDEVAAIAGVSIDHSFLTYKKELLPHGYEVGKISLQKSTISFKKVEAK